MNYFDRKRKYLTTPKNNEYIKDGLQLWLDGIENSRSGHKVDALSVLEDISGNNYDFTLVSGPPTSVGDNCLYFSLSVYKNSNEGLMSLLSEVKERTIEIVCTIDDSDTTAKTIFMGAKSGNASSGVGMWYRPASGGMCTGSATTKAQRISDITNPHTYTAIYDAISLNNTKFYQDNVLCSTATGGSMANSGQISLGGRYYNGSYNYYFKGKIYCVRVYNRQLTQVEIEHNRKIDKERFGI